MRKCEKALKPDAQFAGESLSGLGQAEGAVAHQSLQAERKAQLLVRLGCQGARRSQVIEHELVPIDDLRGIFESLAGRGRGHKNSSSLAEFVPRD